MLSNLILIYIMVIVVFESIAQSCLKQFSESKEHVYLVFGIMSYSIVALLLCKSYDEDGGLGLVNVIWSALSIIISITIGILIFKETIHFHDIIAIIFITLGVGILKFTK